MKDNLFKRLAALLSVKSILTLVLTGVFAVLSASGRIEPEQFMTIFTVIVGFYFGTNTPTNKDEK